MIYLYLKEYAQIHFNGAIYPAAVAAAALAAWLLLLLLLRRAIIIASLVAVAGVG